MLFKYYDRLVMSVATQTSGQMFESNNYCKTLKNILY